VLLDMSAAFDIIDHSIMLDGDAVLEWFASYYVNQTQIVVVRTDSFFVRELRKVHHRDVTDVFEQRRVRHLVC